MIQWDIVLHSIVKLPSQFKDILIAQSKYILNNSPLFYFT